MRHDAGFVVGGTAAEEPRTAFGGLERGRLPQGVIALGLHVMVGIQQHGRRPGRGRLVRDHSRGSVVGRQNLGRETLGGEQFPHRLGGALDLTRAHGIGAHGLDPDQGVEVGAATGQDVVDTGAEIGIGGHDRHSSHCPGGRHHRIV